MTYPGAELQDPFPGVDIKVVDPETGKTATLTIRSPRYLEGMKIGSRFRFLISALAENSAGDAMPPADGFAAVIGDHADQWLQLLAHATGRETEWVANLSDADGHDLAMAVWKTHGPVLVRRAHWPSA